MIKTINIPSRIQEIIISGIKGVKKSLERELKVIDKKVYVNDSVTLEEKEDLRLSFVQSVEGLMLITLPYFDKDMLKSYDELKVYLSGFGYEIIEDVKDEKLKEMIKEAQDTPDNKYKTDLLSDIRVKNTKELFLQFNLFVQRTSLLKDKLEEVKRDVQ